ncbi:unnamed protein product [Arctogadus glacialis]
MPGQGPSPERRDGPGFEGHQAPGSSPMEIDVATPQSMSNGSDVTTPQKTGTASMNPDDFQRSGRVHSGYQQVVPLSHPLTIAVHPGNQQVAAMKQSYIHQRKRPWIRCGLAGAIARGT